MEHAAPLIQTILWVALISAVVWRFHQPIHGILTALQRRIEAGSNVKAGPFELVDQLRPQEPEQQRLKLDAEQLEVLPEPAIMGVGVAPEQPQQPGAPINLNLDSRSQTRARSLQAEDLALRAIQTEYGAPIHRQVTGGRDPGFDGIFFSPGRTNIIEVRFIASRINLFKRLREFPQTIDRLAKAANFYKWPEPHIIFAVVLASDADLLGTEEKIRNALSGLSVQVTTRCFSLDELRRRFGLLSGDA